MAISQKKIQLFSGSAEANCARAPPTVYFGTQAPDRGEKESSYRKN
jgi:hypothetical protein